MTCLEQIACVSFDISAHEYQGRWYNSVRAWNVVHVDPAAAQAAAYGAQPGAMPFPPQSPAAYGAAPAQSPVQPAAPVAPAPSQEDSADDLPF